MASKILSNYQKKEAELTKMMFEQELNEQSPAMDSDQWYIGGKPRYLYAIAGKYGTALRRHDPIAFDVAYQEWKRKQLFGS